MLKREVVEMRRAVTPLTLALQRMGTDHNDLVSIEVRRYLRDVLDHNVQASDRITSYDELLSSLVQAAVGKVAMQQNIDMRKISAYVAIAAVPTAIAGIYGMNFDYMPELHQVWGYPAVLLVMLDGVHAAVPHVPAQPLALTRPRRRRRGSSTSTPSCAHASRIASAPLSRTHAASLPVIGVADSTVTGGRGAASGTSSMSLPPNRNAVNGAPVPQRRLQIDQRVGLEYQPLDSGRCGQDRHRTGQALGRRPAQRDHDLRTGPVQ